MLYATRYSQSSFRGMVLISMNKNYSIIDNRLYSIKLKVKEFIEDSKKISKLDKELISNFKYKFTICEKAYKIMESELKNKKMKNIKINLNSIKSDIRKLEYKVDEKILDELFSHNNERGNKSIKKLRDALTHDIKEKDIIELKSRKTDIFKTMDKFLNQLEKV